MATRSAVSTSSVRAPSGPPPSSSPYAETNPSMAGTARETRTGRSGSRKNKRAVIESDPEDEEMPQENPPCDPVPSTSSGIPPPQPGQAPAATYNMDTDISLLEAPTFTTLDRGPLQPMLSLKWDHKVNLIGKKVVNPMIHCCDTCERPILIYGRMIPCKHVFCLTCATEKSGSCSRCKDKVVRVEQAGLGSIYMCSHGGSRYGNDGCRRTYLSQRDLQAHIQHRHMKAVAQQPPPQQTHGLPVLPSAEKIAEATAALVNARNKSRQAEQQNRTTGFDDKRPNFSSPPPQARGGGGGQSGYPPFGGSNISVIGGGGQSRQSNLITVPIQDKGGASSDNSYYGQQSVGGAPTSGGGGSFGGQFSQPPPNFFGQNAPSSSSSSGFSYESGSSSQWQRTSVPPPQQGAAQQANNYYRR